MSDIRFEIRDMIRQLNPILYPGDRMDLGMFLSAEYCAYVYLRSWWDVIRENEVPDVGENYFWVKRLCADYAHLDDDDKGEIQAWLVFGMTVTEPKTASDYAALNKLTYLKVLANLYWKPKEGFSLDDTIEAMLYQDPENDLVDIEALLWYASVPSDNKIASAAWEYVRRERLAPTLLPLLEPKKSDSPAAK